jgi:serine/threonine protein kinase
LIALANDLEAGFEILWYRIDSVLGRGGFGITYLATDTNLNQLVAIKEYLPRDFATRSGDSTVQPVSQKEEDMFSWGLDRFMSEAQTLAKFRHPNIVRVQSVFKHNNTGYMVMEYEHGRPLNEVYKEKVVLSQKELEDIYYPIIDGLAAVHKQGFIHRDIKPANIYIRDDGSPVLLDFGAARHALGSQTHALTAMLTVGYAPFEQYNEGSGKQGPWTDIYSICACLYQGVKGVKPVESSMRGMALLHKEVDPCIPLSQSNIEGYQSAFLRGIDQGLMIQIHDRPQSLESLMDMLKGNIELEDLPPRPEPAKPINFDKTVIRPLNQLLKGENKESQIQEQQASGEDLIEPTFNTAYSQKTTVVSLPDNPLPDRPVPDSPQVSWVKKWGAIIAAVTVVMILTVAVVWWPGDSTKPSTDATGTNPSVAGTPQDKQQQKISQLLEQANQFYLAGNFFNLQKDHALNRYLQIRSMDEQNKEANTRLKKIAQILLKDADKLIKSNNFEQATIRLDAVALVDPAFPGLNSLQKELSGSAQLAKKNKQLETLLDRGNLAMSSGHLYAPFENSALEIYRSVLSLDADNVAARQGMNEISDRVMKDARKALGNEQLTLANKLVLILEQINPGSPELAEIKKGLSKNNQLNQLIADADKAYNEQRYTTPSKGSAVSLYREILAQAPDNEHANLRLQNIADRYARIARNAIQSKKTRTAESNINILQKHFPSYAGIRGLQTDLKKLKSTPKKTLALPVGVNQQRDDAEVVEDIVGKFVRSFKNRNIQQLKQVAKLTREQESLYSSLFNLYRSLDLKLVAQSFTINRRDGVAAARFKISDLVDNKGRAVTTSANWTKLSLAVRKENGSWVKVEIENY